MVTFKHVALAAGWLLGAWLAFTATLALLALVCALLARSDAPIKPSLGDMLCDALQGWLLQNLSLLAPLYMLVLVWFAKLDDAPSEGAHPGLGTLVRRPRMPAWADWADTPDERGFGLYEPKVMWVYQHLGWRACLYYWLGLRNRLHGLAWAWGQPLLETIDINKPTTNKWRISGSAWQFEQALGFARLILGYKTYVNRFSYGSTALHWAVPTVTMKRNIK